MRVTTVRIRNFRGIRELDLDLGEITVLVGENNSGKTAVLDLLRICLRDLGPRRRSVFEALDFHLANATADPASADPIQIEITFSEQTTGEWSDELIGRLNRDNVLQVDDDGRSHVMLRVTCAYDPESRDFDQQWSFLNLNREPLTGVNERALTGLQREVSYYYLQALRDVRHHFGEKGPFWRPFLKDARLPAEQKAEIERRLREVNDLVVRSHDSFRQVHDGLHHVQDVVPLATGDVVSIEAVPGRIFDMLAKAQINLGSITGARIPLHRHGEGTQSLSVLMLFTAFLEAWPAGAPILALEEPEAHLHPSAVRALWGLVRNFTGQKLISTHSGDLLAETEVHQIRRLARTRDGIRAFRVRTDLLSDEERRKFNYHIRQARGELLFARCWLLVEGETEAWIYPAAARATGVDLHREGIRVVEYRQTDVGLLAKIASALGIAWYCVGDADTGTGGIQANRTRASLKDHLGDSDEADLMVFPYENTDVHLLENGYEDIYEQFMPEQKMAGINGVPGEPDYWSKYFDALPGRAKTRAAAAVAAEMEQRGNDGVTAEIRGVLNRVVAFARDA